MREEDFTFRITGGNTLLDHNNNPGDGDIFDYHPWQITYGEATIEAPNEPGTTVTSVSSLMAEFHLSRIMADGDSQLIVHRNTDDKDIIRIPFIDYLLLVKGNYRIFGDQEYLDRQDEHAMIFFLDEDLNWYTQMGIYINRWHVVPPQDTNLH